MSRLERIRRIHAARAAGPSSAAPSPRAPRRRVIAALPSDPELEVRAAAARTDRFVAEREAELVAPRFGVVPLSVFAENREPNVVAARRAVCKELRALGWSYPRIGRAIGRHHTSVLELVRRGVEEGAHA